MLNNKVANGKWRMVNGGNKPNAFSILEIILAMGLFAIIISGAVGVVLQAFSSTRLGEEVTKATFLANEGLEAVRAIQERDFWSLVTGTHGLDRASEIWKFSGTQDTSGKYTRKIVIYNVYRDGNDDIVPESEGTTFLDLYTKRVESVVTWTFGPARTNTVRLPTYFTYWESALCNWRAGQVVKTLNLDGDADSTAIVVMGDRAYVTTKNNSSYGEFFILDISIPTSPYILGYLRSIGAHVNGLAVSGNYAYLATAKDGKELVVVDIRSPYPNMEAAKSIDIPKTKSANDVSVEGGYAYVVTQKSADGPELHIYNVAKPLDPKRVGEGFEVDRHVYGVKATKDRRVYLATADTERELIIVNVRYPKSPESCDDCHYDAPPGANGQAVDVIRGGVAYLVTRDNPEEEGDAEFYLLNVANPSSPEKLIRSYDVGAKINGVAAAVGFAFLATENGGEEFMILDLLKLLKDPDDPGIAFFISLDGDADAGGGVALLEDECVAFYVTADDDGEDDGNEFQVVQPVVQP